MSADRCPYCGQPVGLPTWVPMPGEPAEPPNGRGPVAGELSICFACAGLCVIGPDLLLRRATTDERQEYLRDQNVVEVLLWLREEREAQR